MLPSFTSLLAPAKVNLSLNIVGRLDNGYHLLDSLVVFLPFGDILRARVTQAGFAFNIVGPYASQLPVSGNLVEVAANLLWERAKYKGKIAESLSLNIEIELVKYLPIGAGLGGGSTDAAAILILLNNLYDLQFSMLELGEIALQIGADVLMGLYAVKGARAAWAGGIGDKIQLLENFPSFVILLVNNNVPVLTKEVFTCYAQQFSKFEADIEQTPTFNRDSLAASSTLTQQPKATIQTHRGSSEYYIVNPEHHRVSLDPHKVRPEAHRVSQVLKQNFNKKPGLIDADDREVSSSGDRVDVELKTLNDNVIEVRAALDSRNKENPLKHPVISDLTELYAFLKIAGNDLLISAKQVEPSLQDLDLFLQVLGAKYVGMSGSGGTFFCLFNDLPSAQLAQNFIAEWQPGWFAKAIKF